jgi:hypothetical protein
MRNDYFAALGDYNYRDAMRVLFVAVFHFDSRKVSHEARENEIMREVSQKAIASKRRKVHLVKNFS